MTINKKETLKEFLAYESKLYGFNSSIKYLLHLFMGMEQALLWQFQRRLRITEYHKNCNHKIRFLINLFFLNRLRKKTNILLNLNVFKRCPQDRG